MVEGGALPIGGRHSRWVPAAKIAAIGLLAAAGWATPRQRQFVSVRIDGCVVNDITGELVERFGLQRAQFTAAKPDTPQWSAASPSGTPRRGQFIERLRFVPAGQKVWIRIIADGYEPVTITPEPVVAPADISGLVVRLRRGASVRGIVLDYLDLPVPDAKVYLAGRTALTLENRRPASTRPFYDSTAVTNRDGSFTIDGVSFAGERLVVVSDTLQMWIAPLPMPGEEAVIRLPEPARFELGFRTEEGEPEAAFELEYAVPGQQPQSVPGAGNRIDCTELFKLKSGSLYSTALTPGAYRLSRTKVARIGNFSRKVRVNPLPFAIEPGRQFRTTLNLTGGGSISGTIAGLEGSSVGNAFITVTTANAAFDPRLPAILRSPAFDFFASEPGGVFKTDRLKPGIYTVIVEVYLPGPDAAKAVLVAGDQVTTSEGGDLAAGGFPFPAMVGSAKVAVPETGNVEGVKVEVKRVR